jgi:hypothetical protein
MKMSAPTRHPSLIDLVNRVAVLFAVGQFRRLMRLPFRHKPLSGLDRIRTCMMLVSAAGWLKGQRGTSESNRELVRTVEGCFSCERRESVLCYRNQILLGTLPKFPDRGVSVQLRLQLSRRMANHPVGLRGVEPQLVRTILLLPLRGASGRPGL